MTSANRHCIGCTCIPRLEETTLSGRGHIERHWRWNGAIYPENRNSSVALVDCQWQSWLWCEPPLLHPLFVIVDKKSKNYFCSSLELEYRTIVSPCPVDSPASKQITCFGQESIKTSCVFFKGVALLQPALIFPFKNSFNVFIMWMSHEISDCLSSTECVHAGNHVR